MNKKFLACAMALTTSFGVFATANVHANAATYKEVTAASLTVHSGPSTNYHAIDWIKKGTEVTVLSEKNGFDSVQYGNKKGYVSDRYLTTVAQKATTASTGSKSVTSYRLTLRSGPSASYKAIDYLKQGTIVQSLSSNNGWDYVSIGGEKGYASSAYLKATSAPVASRPVSSSVSKTVTTSLLNFRSGPSVYNSIIGSLKQGTIVQSLSSNNGWDYISYGGKTGYVSSTYLKTGTTTNTNPSPVPTPAATGSLKGKTIVIDPGHGGQYPGAHGYAIEENTNLAIGLKVRTDLQAMGANVLMTRTANTECHHGNTYTEDLVCRPQLAISNHADMFVSIHANSGASSASGTEAWYYNTSRGDAKLASLLASNVAKDLGLQNRGYKFGDLSVLRNDGPGIPSSLVETAFVTNQSDAAKLNSSTDQAKFAQAIADGINSYFH